MGAERRFMVVGKIAQQVDGEGVERVTQQVEAITWAKNPKEATEKAAAARWDLYSPPSVWVEAVSVEELQ